MSITNFRPTIWAKALQYNLNKKHVHADVMNREYEGEIKSFGDTVKISSIGRVTTTAYTNNAGMGGTDASPTITAIARPEILQGSSLFLNIDQAYYFNFAISDVDKRQQTPKLLNEAMKEAAYSIADRIDTFANQTIQTGVSGTGDAVGNRLSARTIGTGAGDSDAYETLIDLLTLLKENDVVGDYWAIVPPWFVGMLVKGKYLMGYGDAMANGKMGRSAGFEIKESNNLSGATSGTIATAGGVYTILAGVKAAATFAEQLDEIQAYRPHDGFHEAVKGLHVYGAKVTRPYALASVAVTKA